jgi:hypothetical protein
LVRGIPTDLLLQLSTEGDCERGFDRLGQPTYGLPVTVEQVIHEIEALPADEQARVIRFAYRLDAERQLTGGELSSLAARMARSTDPAEAMMLREEIVRGFYGGRPNA